MNWNHFSVSGRLCADPELRYSPDGKAITHGRIACNHRMKDKPALFLSFTFFGKGGEALAKHAAKGAAVLLDGRLEANEYDTKEGEHRKEIRMVATEWTFAEGKQRGEVDGETAPASEEEVPF